jgi:hypothetical protein
MEVDFIVKDFTVNTIKVVPVSVVAKRLVKSYKGVYMSSAIFTESLFEGLIKSSPTCITIEYQ